MNHDILQRFIFENDPVRGEFVILDECFKEVLQQHAYPPAVRSILGEGLCVAALLSAIIKFKGRLTIQFRGKGKLRLLLAQCDDQNQLRGLAKYDEDITEEDMIESFKDGLLVIMLDTGVNGQRYQGVVEWKGRTLAESIEHYFQHSEQLATRIWLSVTDSRASGYLLQVVPIQEKHGQAMHDEIIKPSWQRIIAMTEKADLSIMHQVAYPDFLIQLYPEETLRVFDGTKVKFHCSCTRKRGQDAIYILGREEAEAELADKQVIVVTCDFCNKEYVFDRVDVEQIFHNGDQTPPDTKLH